jgi:tetratricopeptide (TPR) repeat protein
MAVAENNLTWHEIREGDLPAARRRLAAVDRLAARAGEYRLRAVAAANLAEVARLEGHPDEAERLGRRAIGELESVGDPNHRRRVLATVGLALADLGRLDEAEDALAELRTSSNPASAADGPASVVEGAIALARGEEKQAADCFARAAEAYQGAHDPRDVVEALVGLIASTPDADARREPIGRLRSLCRSSRITLLPRERAMLGDEAVRAISAN